MRLIANRASALWARALANVESSSGSPADVCLTYWDTFGGAKLDLAGVEEGTRVVRLVDRAISNTLANKRDLARLLKDSGLDDVAPATCERVEDALRESRSGSIWFVKPVSGTAGKGMYCVSSDELDGLSLPQGSILQHEVEDPILHAGRKFTVRVYVLIWNSAVYLFENGFTVIHGVEYQNGSTDYQVQIDHRGYQSPGSEVRVVPGRLTDAFVEHFPRQREMVKRIRPVFDDCVKAAGRDTYVLLGLDTLICRDGSIQLLEINVTPNFVHTSEVNEQVNVPFFESVLNTVVGCGDARLERV